MEEKLILEGFKKEIIMWSFHPKFYDQANGDYYSKEVPYKGYVSTIEIAVVLNKEFDSMEVYMCNCRVGCCGDDMGIYPFSIEKIKELLTQKMKDLDEIYQKSEPTHSSWQ